MRDIFIRVSVALIWATIIYIVMAFIEWSFNPGDWNSASRWMVAIFGIFLGVFIGFADDGTSKDNLNK